MKMLATRHDLAEDIRVKVNTLLSQHLADGIDLALQAKQAHWNIKGPNFGTLHPLFDDIRAELDGFNDEIAERIVALGGTANGTLEKIAKVTRIPSYPKDIHEWGSHVVAFSDALSVYGQHVRQAIDLSDSYGDKGTSDLFTGISRSVDKRLWMLEAHLQG